MYMLHTNLLAAILQLKKQNRLLSIYMIYNPEESSRNIIKECVLLNSANVIKIQLLAQVESAPKW